MLFVDSYDLLVKAALNFEAGENVHNLRIPGVHDSKSWLSVKLEDSIYIYKPNVIIMVVNANHDMEDMLNILQKLDPDTDKVLSKSTCVGHSNEFAMVSVDMSYHDVTEVTDKHTKRGEIRVKRIIVNNIAKHALVDGLSIYSACMVWYIVTLEQYLDIHDRGIGSGIINRKPMQTMGTIVYCPPRFYTHLSVDSLSIRDFSIYKHMLDYKTLPLCTFRKEHIIVQHLLSPIDIWHMSAYPYDGQVVKILFDQTRIADVSHGLIKHKDCCAICATPLYGDFYIDVGRTKNAKDNYALCAVCFHKDLNTNGKVYRMTHPKTLADRLSVIKKSDKKYKVVEFIEYLAIHGYTEIVLNGNKYYTVGDKYFCFTKLNQGLLYGHLWLNAYPKYTFVNMSL